MVETSYKKCENKEELYNVLTVFISFRKLVKSYNFPSDINDFQHGHCFMKHYGAGLVVNVLDS